MTDDQQFVTGESDPSDFTVDQVAAHLATADDDEVLRVQEAEQDGKARKGVLEWERPEAVPAVVDPVTQDVVAGDSPDAPQVGDEWTEADGYTRRIVSLDGIDPESVVEAAPA